MCIDSMSKIFYVYFQPLKWEASVSDPNRGLVIWAVPENVEITVTLFKDPRETDYEDKEWTFVIEDVNK